MSMKRIGITVFAAVAVIAVVVALIFGLHILKEKPAVTISTGAFLDDVTKINELHTMECTYNSIAEKYSENGKLMYKVAYEGKVIASINPDEIGVEKDEEKGQLTFTLPEPKLEVMVDAGELDYIFLKKIYDKPEVNAEAYQLCIDDLTAKAESDASIKQQAHDFAVDEIKALVEPLVKQDYGYVVVVR